jgi:hypothetical protein
MYVAMKHACKGIGMYKLSKKMKNKTNITLSDQI